MSNTMCSNYTNLKANLDGNTVQPLISHYLKVSHNKEDTFFRLKQNEIELGMLPTNTRRILINFERSSNNLLGVTEDDIGIVWNTLQKTRQLYLVQVSMTTYLIKNSDFMDLLDAKTSRNERDRNVNVRHLNKENLHLIVSYFSKKSICRSPEYIHHKRKKFNKNAEAAKKFYKPNKNLQRFTKVYSTVRSLQSRQEHSTVKVLPERLSVDLKARNENIVVDRHTAIQLDANDNELYLMAYPLSGHRLKNPTVPSYDDDANKPVQATDADMGEMSLPSSSSIFHHDQQYAKSFVASGAAFKLPSPPVKYPDFASYERRINSFFNGQWSSDKPPPNELAELGLFLKEGEGDLTRCFQCGIGFKDWSESDDPLKERVKYSSNCHFLVQKIGQSRIDALKQAINNPDQTGQGPHNMKSPRYQTMRARIDSFREFPRSVNITPKQFAVAGLYYTGDGDLCRCFTCDGGLKTWDVDDDPIVEHALYFPNCPYIIKLKGEAYIRMIQRENPKYNPTGSNSASKQSGDATNDVGMLAGTSVTTGLQVPDNTDLLEVNMQNMTMASNTDEYSEHAVSQLSQKLGFSDADVTRAIVELEIKGNRKPSMSEILNMLLDMKEQDEKYQEQKKHEAEHGKSVSTLLNENQMMSKQVYCMLCVTSESNVLFLPCTHHRVCAECAKEITNCPVCNCRVGEKIRTYRS